MTPDKLILTVLRLSIPLNLSGALVFTPWLAPLRQQVGLPPLGASYAWLMSAWVGAFAIAFLHMVRRGAVEPTLVAVAAAGKLAFFGAMVHAAVTGEGSSLAVAAAAPDLLFGAALLALLTKRS